MYTYYLFETMHGINKFAYINHIISLCYAINQSILTPITLYLSAMIHAINQSMLTPITLYLSAMPLTTLYLHQSHYISLLCH